MAEDTTPDGKPAGAGSEAPKTYSQEEWSGLQSKYEKTSSAMKKQISNMESELTDYKAKIEAFDEGKGKNDEEFVQLKTDYARKVKQLERRENELVSRELKLHKASIAKEYGVEVAELEDFKSPEEAEIYALKKWKEGVEKGKVPPPPADKFDRRSGSSGNYSETLRQLADVDVSKMSKKEAEEHLAKLNAGVHSL